MPITRIISGGQTGVDQAALRAAIRCGLATGGTAPHGWLTEAGPAPWLADYGLVEGWDGGSPSRSYRLRTRENARNSDVTLWVGPIGSTGYHATLAECRDLTDSATDRSEARYLILSPRLDADGGVETPEVRDLVRMIRTYRYSCLNVAGNRESRAPGIGAWAEEYLTRLFTHLKSVG